MRSIQRRFEQIKKKNPYWSSWTSYAMSVVHQKFSQKNVYYWFNKLVEKDDYIEKEKKYHLFHLMKLTNMVEAGIKRV